MLMVLIIVWEYNWFLCFFLTTRDMSCDFTAIEMNETILNEYDVTFRRDDGKGINAHLYEDILEMLASFIK